MVIFEAKTDELEQHYLRDFGARPVASLHPGGPRTFMIADQAAKDIFSSYLYEEKGGKQMKPYDKDIDIVFSPMSDETMSWLDELLTTCKRFGVDYYNASEKDRTFVEAVARKNYGIKQAKMNGVSVSTVEPFFGIHRAV